MSSSVYFEGAAQPVSEIAAINAQMDFLSILSDPFFRLDKLLDLLSVDAHGLEWWVP